MIATEFRSSLVMFEAPLRAELNEMDVVEYYPGSVILKEFEYIKAIPLILEGSIKVRRLDPNGREIIFYHIGPGESCILSITSCLNQRSSQAEAIIERSTQMIVVPPGRVRAWMDNYSSWRRFVQLLYYNRMAEMMTLVDQVLFKSVDTRLVQHLKSKAVNNELHTTHQQLAGDLGTAREVISRLLKQMERKKLISLERGKINILVPL